MANLQRSEVDGVTVLRLVGSLCADELADVEKAFRDATHRDGAAVLIDLQHVDFLGTPAIAMFLDAAKTLKQTGGKIVVTGPQSLIGEVLKRLHLEKLLPVVSSVEEGVRKLTGV